MSDFVSKAVKHSNLPRAAGRAAPRAEGHATSDPLPEGKVLDSAPEHHFDVEPASHDVERAQPKSAEQLGEQKHQLEKLQRVEGRQHVPHGHRSDLQSGMDWSGAATTANKKMDANQRH